MCLPISVQDIRVTAEEQRRNSGGTLEEQRRYLAMAYSHLPQKDIQSNGGHCDQKPDHTKDPDIDLIIGHPLSNVYIILCDFAGLNFGFEVLKDINCSLIVKTTFRVV